ncbi:MAG: adenosylmethionine--8-amino-7-oxononanoate transaminase [Alphaproteobacteria bacterium]|nr:adenosylmethionine--8-amino-7-oxononanoate transaminase [Alphaproteobacteria bacterium]
MLTQPDWFEAGLPHIWLPYTQMKIAPKPQAVAATEGCRIKLADGRELVDGIASWWSACHGYNHPHILAAMKEQLETMPHVMFGGLVHAPALTLAKRLAAMTGLPRVFFADSGSVAVEIALKMALQYWRIKAKPNKDRFLCFRDGYHGDTLGAMSVSDPQRSLHKAFQNSVIKQYVVDIPSDEYGFAELDGLLAGVAGNLAGMIIEPLVQGAGGMCFYSADTLAELHRLAKKHGLLFIADEIATGFFRTGSRFACDEAGVMPDIMCLGKALTGGAINLGAALASEEIYSAFLSDKFDDAFMHGPTYMANPLASAAANASLDLFEREPRSAQVEAIEQQLTGELAACEGLAGVVDVRVKGAIGVVQIEPSRMDYYGLREKFIARGCWIRPFKDIIYLAPSFTISSDELSQLTGAIASVLSAPAQR